MFGENGQTKAINTHIMIEILEVVMTVATAVAGMSRTIKPLFDLLSILHNSYQEILVVDRHEVQGPTFPSRFLINT